MSLCRYAFSADFKDFMVICRLILGFVMEPNGSVSTVSSSSLQLFQTGEDGNDPDDCAFHFTAGNHGDRLVIFRK